MDGGYTPLLLAVYYDCHPEVVEFLINNGAEVNVTDDQGNSPLHYAKEKGRTTVVELLGSHGARE